MSLNIVSPEFVVCALGANVCSGIRQLNFLNHSSQTCENEKATVLNERLWLERVGLWLVARYCAILFCCTLLFPRPF
jgi:hypothetical protein